MNIHELCDELDWMAGEPENASSDGLRDVHRRAARRRKTRIGAIVSAVAVIAVLVIVAAVTRIPDASSRSPRIEPADPRPSTTATTTAANSVAQEIYGSGKVNVMGPNGIAGWAYTSDLNYPTTAEDFKDIDALNAKLRNWAAPVHDESGAVIGYWVTNGVGFVDLATYDSPDYDPDALRNARPGGEATQALQAELHQCLDEHAIEDCAPSPSTPSTSHREIESVSPRRDVRSAAASWRDAVSAA